MATGFEVAGLALAIFPVAINAIMALSQAIKTGKDLRSYKLELRQLGRELENEKCIFNNTCQRVLNDLVAHELLDEAMAREMMDSPGGGLWQSAQLQKRLKSRFGPVEGTVENWIETVKEVQHTLENIVKGSNIEYLTQDQEGLKPLHALKAVITVKPFLREKIDEIGRWNHHLERLAHNNQPPPIVTQRSHSKSDILKLCEYHSRIREHAQAIYHALKEKLENSTCACPGDHIVNLQLQGRALNYEVKHTENTAYSGAMDSIKRELMFRFFFITAHDNTMLGSACNCLAFSVEHIGHDVLCEPGVEKHLGKQSTEDADGEDAQSSSTASRNSMEPNEVAICSNLTQATSASPSDSIPKTIMNNVARFFRRPKLKGSVLPETTIAVIEPQPTPNPSKMSRMFKKITNRSPSSSHPPSVQSQPNMLTNLVLDADSKHDPFIHHTTEGKTVTKKVAFQGSTTGSSESGHGTPISANKQEELGVEERREIECFCSALTKFLATEHTTTQVTEVSRAPCIGVLIGKDSRKHRVWFGGQPSQNIQQQPDSFISLADLIREVPQHQAPTEQDCFVLGLQLASSVMQLHATGWLTETWSSDDISFVNNGNPFDEKKYLQNEHNRKRPFVSQKFFFSKGGRCHIERTDDSKMDICNTSPEQLRQTSTLRSVPVNCNPSLYCLGIVLIELWNWQTFHSLYLRLQGRKYGTEATPALQHWVALELVSGLYRRAPPEYADAVSLCISGLGLRKTSLEHIEFRKEVYLKILHPLKKNVQRIREADRLESEALLREQLAEDTGDT